MRALILRPNTHKLEIITMTTSTDPHDTDGQYTANLTRYIGGDFTGCFRTESTDGTSIYGYCLDMLTGKGNWTVALGPTLRTDAPYFIGGPLVIGGCDADGGIRDLTDEEIAQFHLMLLRTQHIPMLQREARPLHPLTRRETESRVHTFTRNGLPLGFAIVGRKLSVVTKSVGPKEDPYALTTYRVRVSFPDLTWAEWVLERDSLAQEDRMYVRTSVSTKVTHVHSMRDTVLERFQDMAGVRVDRFEQLMWRSVGDRLIDLETR